MNIVQTQPKYPDADQVSARHHMIDGVIAPNGVSDERVIAALGVVPREEFVPASHYGCAYVDSDISLLGDRSLMSPIAIARLLQALSIQEHEKMLIVAGGTGYSAALAAHLGADVTLVEDQHVYAKEAERLMALYGLGKVKVVQTSLSDGCRVHAPYDLLLIDGGATHIPENLMQQLAPHGRIGLIEKMPGSNPQVAGMGQVIVLSNDQGNWDRAVQTQAAVATIPVFAQAASFTF